MSALTMVQRIEEERKDRKLGEIKELNLDGCTATEIEGLTDEYCSLEKLSIVGAGLTSLAGFPALTSLIKLDLSGNPIASGLEDLAKCTNLTSLNLSGNKLSSVKELAPLASLENLSYLEMGDCELVSQENYRKEVFAILPQLAFLDGLDQNGVEESEIKASGDGLNGSANGHGAHDDEEEEDEESEDEEEVGISILQGSKELESDEEDYVPGEEEEEDPELDEDEEEEEEDEDVEDPPKDLSAADVTGPRRAQKRAADEEGDEATASKVPATEEADE